MECDESPHVWRPRTLEDLIPEDVRERWGIKTATPIQWPRRPDLSLEEKEREIGVTIEVRNRDRNIRDVMVAYKIPTVHKMEANKQKLREWAVANGKKICFIQDEGGVR